MMWLAVALGAAIGAPMRYLVEVAIQVRVLRLGRTAAARTGFPWALLIVNAAGSAVAGLVVGAAPMARTALLVGFCGALTTYSGFAAHLDLQWRADRAGAWISIIVMPSACVAAFFAARALAQLVGW